MRNKYRMAVGLFLAVAVMSSLMPGVAAAKGGDVTVADVSVALNKTRGLLVQASTDSIANVPSKATDGVTLKAASGGTVIIRMPNASTAGNGIKVARGATAYSGTDSANAVIGAKDGVQFLTVIGNSKASSTYSYEADGGRFLLSSSGSVMLVHDDGSPVAMFAPPWAYDSKGKLVRTKFITDGGNTLAQVVEHKGAGVSYPVVADPHVARYWNGLVVTLNRGDMQLLMYGGSQALVSMLFLPGVGWGWFAGMLYVSGYATWAYQNRKCAWFWVSWDRPTWGWYDC